MFTRLCAKLGCSKLEDADGPDQHPHPVNHAATVQTTSDGKEAHSEAHSESDKKANGSDNTTRSDARVEIPDYDESSPTKRNRDQERDRLWDIAFAGLDEKTKLILSPEQKISPEESIAKVQKQVEGKYEEYQKGALQIRNTNGTTLNFRDVTCRMLNAVIKIKPIFSSVASLDPTGHGKKALLRMKSSTNQLLAENRYTYGFFKPLIQHEQMKQSLGPSLILQVADFGTSDAMQTLIEEMGQDFHVTEQAVLTAIWNCHGHAAEMLTQLLGFPESANWNRNKLFLRAIHPHCQDGLRCLMILLNAFDADFAMDEEFMLRAVAHDEATAILKFLLGRQQNGFIVNENVLLEAISSEADVVPLLLKNGGLAIPVNDDMIRAAAKNGIRGESVLRLLSDVHEFKLHVPAEAFLDAMGSPKILQTLFDLQKGSRVTKEMFMAACYSPDCLSILLNQQHQCVPVEDMLDTIALNGVFTADVFWLLLDHGLIEMGEGILEKVACNATIIEQILARYPDVPVTQKAFERAAASGSPLVVRTLLETKFDNLTITEQIMEAPFHYVRAHPPEGKFILVGKAGPTTTAVLRAFLVRLGSDAPITEDLLLVACKYEHTEPLRFLLEQRRTLDLQSVWERLWQKDMSFKRMAAVMDVLLQYGSLALHDYMLESILSSVQQAANSEEDPCIDRTENFIRYCLEKTQVHETGRMLEILAQLCTLRTVERFLDSKPNLKVTTKVIEAAENSPITRGQDLMAFLSSKLPNEASEAHWRTEADVQLWEG